VQLHSKEPDRFQRLISLTTKGMLILALPISALISAYSQQIMSVVYGARYAGGAPVLSILIWCIVPMYLYFYLIFVNVSAGHANYNFVSGIVAVVSGLIGNAVLLPRMGYIGTAWAALLANAAFALLCCVQAARLFRQARIPRILAQMALSGAVIVMTIQYSTLPYFLVLPLILSVYLLLLVALRAVGLDEFSLARRTVRLWLYPKSVS
jgi:O-antigen/teichoic acid export membrane protein